MEMYDNHLDFVSNNSALLALQIITGLIFYYGIYKGSLKICILPIAANALIISVASLFLHAYCYLAGVEFDSIESYNYAVLSAILFWLLVLAVVVGLIQYLGKQLPDESITNSESKTEG